MENDINELPFNRNERQFHFNKIKGEVSEINLPNTNSEKDNWCSITLKVGHENQRQVNLSIKKPQLDVVLNSGLEIGSKVVVLFYLTSRFKNNRWYSTANVLQVDYCND